MSWVLTYWNEDTGWHTYTTPQGKVVHFDSWVAARDYALVSSDPRLCSIFEPEPIQP